MNFLEIIKIAFRALKTNKTRSFLTMLGIIIGVSSVILLVSIGTGLEKYVTSQLEGLGANTIMVIPGFFEVKPGGGGSGGMPGAGTASSKFTLEMANTLEQRGETITAVMPYTENNCVLKYRNNTHITQVAGVSYKYPNIRNQSVSLGKFFSLTDEKRAKRVAVIGKTIVDELFIKNEDPVFKRIKISDQSFLVLGVLEEKGALGNVDMDNQVFIPTTTALKVFGMDHVQAFWIQSKNTDTIKRTKEEAEKILLRYLKKEDFSIIDTKSILSTVSSVLDSLTIALMGITSISLLVGGIGIMNIMLVSVTERTREIGLRKAVGATPKAILTQFLFEAIFLSLCGGTIGIILGFAGSLVLGNFLKTAVPVWAVLVAFFISSMVGIVFGVAPAYKAAKLNPIDALRYE